MLWPCHPTFGEPLVLIDNGEGNKSPDGLTKGEREGGLQKEVEEGSLREK